MTAHYQWFLSRLVAILSFEDFFKDAFCFSIHEDLITPVRKGLFNVVEHAQSLEMRPLTTHEKEHCQYQLQQIKEHYASEKVTSIEKIEEEESPSLIFTIAEWFKALRFFHIMIGWDILWLSLFMALTLSLDNLKLLLRGQIFDLLESSFSASSFDSRPSPHSDDDDEWSASFLWWNALLLITFCHHHALQTRLLCH